MLSDKQKELIEKIEKLQEKLESDFAEKYPVIFKDLSKQILEITAPVRFGGSSETRAKELLQVIKLKKQIVATIGQNEAYNEAIKTFTDGYKELRDLTDEYYGILIDTYKPKQNLYNSLVKVAIENTKDALLGSGVQAALADPIVSSLISSLSSKTAKTTFDVLLRDLINGTKTTKPILQSEIKRLAGDSMMIFQRSYIDAVSSDLNISYFIYSGTVIKTTRPFCKSKVGKVFKKSEIEKWAGQSWAGKMPNTNKETIFALVGGYNCRHNLWPATKAQYQIQQKREKK